MIKEKLRSHKNQSTNDREVTHNNIAWFEPREVPQSHKISSILNSLNPYKNRKNSFQRRKNKLNALGIARLAKPTDDFWALTYCDDQSSLVRTDSGIYL